MGFGLAMLSKGIMTRAAIAVAILLFIINPVVHQHYRASVPDCGSISAFTASSAACSVCTFQTNVAIETPAAAADETPHVAPHISSAPQATLDSELVLLLPSRAPPAIS
jgi:hypothetical protein